jgi:hypothetical protein
MKSRKTGAFGAPCAGNEDLKQKLMPYPKQEPDGESRAKRTKMKSGFVAFTGAHAAADRFLHARGQTKPNREKTPASSAANKKGEQKYSGLKTATSYLYERNCTGKLICAHHRNQSATKMSNKTLRRCRPQVFPISTEKSRSKMRT